MHNASQAKEHGLLDLAVQWMEKAIEKCDDATVELYQVMTESYQQLRESHDHILVTKGPTWTTILAEEKRYRTKDVPFSEKMKKNKRYKKGRNVTSKGSSNYFVQPFENRFFLTSSKIIGFMVILHWHYQTLYLYFF